MSDGWSGAAVSVLRAEGDVVSRVPNIPPGYPKSVDDLASARAFLVEARDIHQQWVDAIEHPLCTDTSCADCDEYRTWLDEVLGVTGGADWHRRWVTNYDLILQMLPAVTP